MPIFSLPGRHGIGDLGESSYEFVEFLKASGFKIWQILPLNPSSDANSPYTPYSSYAGDEIYISLEQLVKDGLLDDVVEFNEEACSVDYEKVRSFKDAYLRLAFSRFKLLDDAKIKHDFHQFQNEAFWLGEYASFMAINRFMGRVPWTEWPKDVNSNLNMINLQDERTYQRFIQFLFYRQFDRLKEWAHRHEVSIMGDIPFYVGLDSADVFFNRDEFLINESDEALYVSGASPDYFTDEGQLWGHPIYNWNHLRKTNYRFWMDRIKWNSRVFDILRIDHFRAFDTYWQIPAKDKTARNGKWVEGPGSDFFKVAYSQIPKLNLVVEDLGELRPQVHDLRDEFNMMGMRIIQYGFGPNEEKENYQIPEWSVAYTGTHDNNPLEAWKDELSLDERFSIEDILDKFGYPGENMCERVYYRTFACEAMVAIVQVQDILKLSSGTRINLPGTVGEHNWSWKLKDFESLIGKTKLTRSILQKTNRL